MKLKSILLGLVVSAGAIAQQGEYNLLPNQPLVRDHDQDRIRYRCRVVAYDARGKALDHMYGPLSHSVSGAESEAESECRGYLYQKRIKNGSCVVGDCFSYEM